ncbi:MAG: ATP-binding protein, partial [Clostridia bacterium]|nr:ATP-binding protein [Clostridia bacterium]
MPIIKPEKMNFSDKNIIMIISGLPGTGKTTLALSAPDVLLIDTDEGMARVNPAHRKDASICKTYEEILADLKAAEGTYKSIVIDTCGALIEYMKDWAMRTDPKASKKDGGFSLQGYGIVKAEFIRFSTELRKRFNVIYLFHEQTSRNGDDGVFYDLVADGSCKVICWQPADLGAHLFIQNGRRYLGFTPTEQYSAKSAYGIKGLIEVPELKDGDPNDFLTKLFAKVRANLAAESASIAPEKEAYEKAMEMFRKVIADIKTPENVMSTVQLIKVTKHGLTSEKEAKAMLKAKMDELGIVWDKGKKAYVY